MHTCRRRCTDDYYTDFVPGFSDYLDVVGVERYLRDKGYRFTDDAIELSTDDAMMSNDFLNVETDSSANPKVPVELPFGLVDPDAHVVEGGLLSPRSQGSPQLDDWTQVSIPNLIGFQM